jgi:hypothetical protein
MATSRYSINERQQAPKTTLATTNGAKLTEENGAVNPKPRRLLAVTVRFPHRLSPGTPPRYVPATAPVTRPLTR